MFGSKRRAEKRAAEEAAEKEHDQAELRANLVDLIDIAGGAVGDAKDWPLILKSGERLVYAIDGGGLFEPRRLPGHWKGRSAGVSVPVVDGVRLRLGKSAGTFVQGDETPTIIDTGDVSITTQRVVFQGSKYTREWPYSKLVGIMHYADQPRTAIQVSNREKTSGIVYTNPLSGLVRLRLTVAVAIFNGEAEQTAQQLRGELAALDSGTPAAEAATTGDAPPAEGVAPPPDSDTSTAGLEAATPPVAMAADNADTQPPVDLQARPVETPDAPSNPIPDPAGSESPPTLPPPAWASDPSGRHQLRYWDGTRWTDYVADNGQESRDPYPISPS